MSTSDRICETCVYCSFAGNCDRYNKPLISIEQPACDTYEIHPLLAENAKLRELVRDMHKALFSLNLDHCQACPRDRINGPCTKFMVCGSDECSIEKDMRELGVEV